jgi:hypothetical protein
MIYMAVVLWSVAGLSIFKFLGAMWFLTVRMVSHFLLYCSLAHSIQPDKLTPSSSSSGAYNPIFFSLTRFVSHHCTPQAFHWRALPSSFSLQVQHVATTIKKMDDGLDFIIPGLRVANYYDI